MFKYKLTSLFLICLFLSSAINAEENVGQAGKSSTYKKGKLAAPCEPSTSTIDLDINNVRARLLGGGDMWWDLLDDAKYEIPKVEPGSGKVPVHSLFAGALWIGGIDKGGQLKIAAQTYRQTGNDFWPGPLNSIGSVDDVTCSNFDKHWKVNLDTINVFLALVEELKNPNTNAVSVPIGSIPRSILEWPGKGNPHAVGAKGVSLNLSSTKNLAPFVDYNTDDIYNPEDGDYPALYQNSPDNIPDQMIWWVYNDKGNIHTETGGEAIGLEVQATAFGFSTSDEINDMTFYRYKVENFSTSVLDSVYFGQWVDADLGEAFDDFVGVDAPRALGICYNGDAVDGPAAAAYGANPPIVGVDFFQGPKVPIYDSSGVNIIGYDFLGMSKFLYYDNNFTVIGNPEIASHFYGYLSGSWKDGSPFTFGGNGYGGSIPIDYMFPDDPGAGGWSECDEGNTPFDRRFVQSSGAFTLEPGAENEVVVGAVWVRPGNQTGCLANFDALRVADDKAQALFDNNFKIINGPDAPNMDIRELDKKIILALSNPQNSNNYLERYEEADPIIKSVIEALNDPAITDSTYNFQGYLVYQLKNAQVSASEFTDPQRARLIAQVDIEDNIDKLVNFTFDPNLGADVPQLMVTGQNEGIRHTFVVTEDAFASGDKNLVNFKTYYFAVVAYATNNYIPYDPADPISQKKPFLQGRQNIKVYSAVPHKPAPAENGLILNADYGDGPNITRIEGAGNGGNILELTKESEEEIVQTNFMAHPVYEKNLGPVEIKIYDPVKVPNANFELEFIDASNPLRFISPNARWVLRNLDTGIKYESDTTIAYQNEQLIPELGISVTIHQVPTPGGNKAPNNGFLDATKTYASPEVRWLTAVPEGEQSSVLNWIKAGTYVSTDNPGLYDDYTGRDPDEVYESILGSTWAPFALAGGLLGNSNQMPTRSVLALHDRAKMDSLHSVLVVLTPDKSKWSRTIVVEQAEEPNVAQGNRYKLAMRDHASWTGEIDANGEPIYDQNSTGYSYFPGYAINLSTGERLNIIFGEDSWLAAENGADMIWNPTSSLYSAAAPGGVYWRMGGRHYIYVSNTRYDGGEAFHDQFVNDQSTTKNVSVFNIFQTVTWFSPAMLANGYQLKPISEGIIPTETKIQINVGTPYKKFVVTGENNGINKYGFNFDGLAPTLNVDSVAVSALDLIRAVPNPYYAYSRYEQSQLDNRIKIINLPSNCTVSIYSSDGALIRRFDRDVPGNTSSGAELSKTNFDTSLEWDLRNHKNIPVASGMYLIHVNAPGIGEKVVKFFCIMRPIDLDSF